MVSLSTYEALDLWVPIMIAVILAIASVILVTVGFRCYDGNYLPRIFIEIIQLNFPDLKAKKDKSDCSGSFNVDIDGSKLHKNVVIILAFLVVPATVSTMFVTFWNVYLVEEEMGGDCVPNFDCFPMYHGEHCQRMPVDNCSQVFDLSDKMIASVVDLNNVTAVSGGQMEDDGDMEIRYECYRLVFRYAEGIGAAGGVLFFTGAFSKLYFGLLVAISSMKNKSLKIVLSIIVWVCAGILCLLFIVLNASIPIVREAVFQTNTDIIQFAMYAANFILLVVCGLFVSFGIWWPTCSCHHK
jgi:hypothetical protein